ncbi:MAG: 16S rRNA (cytosine(1402)-N(4))-methyltransferase RsmH, partial [Pseudomonadota bacterium]
MTTAFEHIPVLAAEAAEALAPRADARIVDATFGAGGYSRVLLAAADCRVLGLDRDPDAAPRARPLSEAYPDRFVFRAGRFGAMDALAAEAGFAPADGVAMDLGTSSPQLDDAERGFSFMRDGPLDMRMEKAGPSAAEIVNSWTEAQLATLFRDLGEERGARAAARAICAQRPFDRTGALADAIANALAARYRGQPIHPATRCFQALRIAVNDEL